MASETMLEETMKKAIIKVTWQGMEYEVDVEYTVGHDEEIGYFIDDWYIRDVCRTDSIELSEEEKKDIILDDDVDMRICMELDKINLNELEEE